MHLACAFRSCVRLRQGPTVLPFQGAPGGLDTDPLGFAANTIAGQLLQNSSSSYLQKGQAYVQSKIGLLSGSAVHYHFNVDSAYIASKLFMIVAPFLKQWSWTRSLEQVCLGLPVVLRVCLRWSLTLIQRLGNVQIAGGNKYMPPRQDVNAPDLYIPFMAVFTYCVLSCVAKVGTGTFSPATMNDMVRLLPFNRPVSHIFSGRIFASTVCLFGFLCVRTIKFLTNGGPCSQAQAGILAWIVHSFVIRILLYILGISNAQPITESIAYGGYPFVAVCLATLARLATPFFGTFLHETTNCLVSPA